MSYGNAYFRGWLRLCLLLVSLFPAVVWGQQRLYTLNTSYSNPSGNPTSISESCTVTVNSVTPEGSSFRLNVTAAATVTKATNTAGVVEVYPVINGVLGSRWVYAYTSAVSDTKTVDYVIASNATLAFEVRFRTTVANPTQTIEYSDTWRAPRGIYRLQWQVQNTLQQRSCLAVFVVGSSEDLGYFWASSAMTGPDALAGEVAVVSWYVTEGDTRQFSARFVDGPASRAKYGPPKMLLTYLPDWWPAPVDASDMATGLGWAYSGAVPGGPQGESKGWQQGVAVAALPVAGGQIGGTTPGTVPTGSTTTAATGKEVTDAANAQIAQAHVDAAGIQGSIDGVGRKIDALGTKLGTATGGGTAGDSPQAKSAADAAQATKNSMTGTSETSAATSSAQTQAGTARTNGDSVVSQFGTKGTVEAETTAAPIDSLSLDIGTGTNVTFTLNPFSANGPFGGVLRIVATWVRKLIAWGLVLTFFIWCLGRLREMCAAPFATAPFGDSIVTSVNSIKVLGSGGGVGYAVKIVAYAAVAAILLTMPLATMALLTAGLPWSTLTPVLTGGLPALSGGNEMLAQAMWYADQVVPWQMLLGAPIWYFVVEAVLFPSQLFWMMFIKFLPL